MITYKNLIFIVYMLVFALWQLSDKYVYIYDVLNLAVHLLPFFMYLMNVNRMVVNDS